MRDSSSAQFFGRDDAASNDCLRRTFPCASSTITSATIQVKVAQSEQHAYGSRSFSSRTRFPGFKRVITEGGFRIQNQVGIIACVA